MKTASRKKTVETVTDDDSQSLKIEGLSDKQAAFLPALLASPTVKEACFKARVSEASAWRWLNGDAAFREQYRIARRQMVEHVIVRIQTEAGDAAKVLRDVANDTAAPASARISAAKSIIELAMRAVELGDVEARLETVEDYLAKKQTESEIKDKADGTKTPQDEDDDDTDEPEDEG